MTQKERARDIWARKKEKEGVEKDGKKKMCAECE